jgi:hypothetical protein
VRLLGGPVIRTKVDDLIELLKQVEQISLPEASSRLGIGQDVLQQWVDFLVEEKMVGVEYKFTTPYLYYAGPKDEGDKNIDILSIDDFKDQFIQSARERNIPENMIPQFWKKHLVGILEEKKAFFLSYCKQKNIPEPDKLFEQFKNQMTI